MSEYRKPRQALVALAMDRSYSVRTDALQRVALGRAHLVPLDIGKPSASGVVPGPNPWRAGLNPRTTTGNARFARRARR